jgi:hypothetical protein
MKRSLCLFALALALVACGTAEIPATSLPTAQAAALVARPTVTVPPPTPTRTPLPTRTPTEVPTAVPTAEPTTAPTATQDVPATAEPTAEPTEAPLLLAGLDPATWVTYQNDQYGFSLRYPPCLGQVFEDEPYSRPAGLYTEGYNRQTARMITTTLELSSAPVSPDCVAQSMAISVWDLASYSHYNIYTELTYDPASDSWMTNSGRGSVPDEDALVSGDGWQGHPLGFGDAEFVSTGLAVPWEEHNVMLEISFGYIYSQDGPPSQGMDGAAIDQILQSLRLTP